jgi:glycosyltransferase involved in cell wall biosynthesis
MGTLKGSPNPPAMVRAGQSPAAPHAFVMGTLEGSPNPPAMVRAGQSPAAPHAMPRARRLPWKGMRIAFLIYGGLDQVTGGTIYDRHLVEGLRALGDTVDVHALPVPRRGRAWLANLSPLPAALGRYDVVLEDELVHLSVFGRHRFIQRAGVPVVSLVHNLTGRQPSTALRPLAAFCERVYLGTLQGMIAVCQSTLADARAGGGASLPAVVAYAGREAITSLPDDPAVAARARAPGPLRVLFVGVVGPHKGLDRLLAALAGALASGVDVTLDVAGSLTRYPRHVVRIRAAITRLGLGDRVQLHGEIPADALRRLYRERQLLALPSEREAYPLSGVEALAHGLPLLLTNQGGTSELLADSGAGQLLPPSDIPGWAKALASLAHDRERLAAMASAALARHRAHGTWSDTARVVQTFLRQITSKRFVPAATAVAT